MNATTLIGIWSRHTESTFAAANRPNFNIRRVDINKQSFLLQHFLLESASDSAVASRLYSCVWTLLGRVWWRWGVFGKKDLVGPRREWLWERRTERNQIRVRLLALPLHQTSRILFPGLSSFDSGFDRDWQKDGEDKGEHNGNQNHRMMIGFLKSSSLIPHANTKRQGRKSALLELLLGRWWNYRQHNSVDDFVRFLVDVG